MENIVNAVISFLSGTGLAIAQAIVVLLLGLIAIKTAVNVLKRGIVGATNKKTVATFISSFVKVVLTFILIIVVFNILSIPTSGLIELLSASVLAIGLALKDSVSHIASGLIIVATNPFKEGDYVKINGLDGIVKSVNIFNTHIKTFDNKIVIVPNSSVVGNNIVNYDALAIRRVDIKLYVAYSSDLKKCREVFSKTVNKNSKVLKVPAPSFILSEYQDSSLVFTARVWTRKENYWDVYNSLMEDFYTDMEAEGIDIPFNRLDVHIREENNTTTIDKVQVSINDKKEVK